MFNRFRRRLKRWRYHAIVVTMVIVGYLHVLSPESLLREKNSTKHKMVHSSNTNWENAMQGYMASTNRSIYPDNLGRQRSRDHNPRRQWTQAENGSKPLSAAQAVKFVRGGHMNRRIRPFTYHSVKREYTPLINWAYLVTKRKKILTKYSFSYDIMPERLDSERPYLIIMVLSVAKHQRTAIRQTYGSVLRGKRWPGSNIILNAKLIFLLGRTPSEVGQAVLSEENVAHGDILQGNFIDTYRNLTLKVLMGLNYVSEYYPSTQYVLKADEDTFTDVDVLVRLLKKLRPVNSVLGHIYLSPPVLRTGKWAVSVYVYPFTLYPRYASGNTYVMSMDLGRCVVQNASLFPYTPIEDAFITGIMCVACNCKQYHVNGFTHWFERAPFLGEFLKGSKISANRVTDKLKYNIWKKITEKYRFKFVS
ncbi:beta-1,3-galactosyltransferase 1-like [Haliotis cracherodii]|uniref:beta-1,3-galactosyltransferase 1-like n=1 Tax=Haliotis cracherodii TaxID=6455 RepID=UPI0039E89B0C